MFEHDIKITGKHAEYIKRLVSDAGLFERYYDVYLNGAIVGLRSGQREERDRISEFKDVTATIFADVMTKNRAQLEYAYRLVMILDDSRSLSLEEKIDRAFRDDSDEKYKDNLKENMEIFNSYVRGGITILFNKIIGEEVEKERYLKKAYDFVKIMDSEHREDEDIFQGI